MRTLYPHVVEGKRGKGERERHKERASSVVSLLSHNNLSKAPSPNTNILGIRVPICGHKHLVHNILRSRIAGSDSNSICSCLKNSHTVFHSGYTILHFHKQNTGSQFLYILDNTWYFMFMS